MFYASYFYILGIHQLVMKKIAALVETTRVRATTTESGSTVLESAYLKSSVFKRTQHTKACRNAPAKVITMNVSGEIETRYFNYLLIHWCFLCQCCKDEDDDPDLLY